MDIQTKKAKADKLSNAQLKDLASKLQQAMNDPEQKEELMTRMIHYNGKMMRLDQFLALQEQGKTNH